MEHNKTQKIYLMNLVITLAYSLMSIGTANDLMCLTSARKVVRDMQEMWLLALRTLKRAKDSDSAYTSRARPTEASAFNVNDLVLVRMCPTNRNQLNKPCPLADRWAGPYSIQEVANDNFRLRLPDTVRARFGRLFNAIELGPMMGHHCHHQP